MRNKLVVPTIVDALKKDGALELEDLYKLVQNLLGEVDMCFFEETLMDLEIQGLIRVLNTTKDRRRIELSK